MECAIAAAWAVSIVAMSVVVCMLLHGKDNVGAAAMCAVLAGTSLAAVSWMSQFRRLYFFAPQVQGHFGDY